MINYTKVRQSVEKNASKKSLSRTNKSHTSSINIKLNQQATIQNIKIPIKGIFKQKSDNHSQHKGQGHTTGQKKYSVKLQSNQKENKVRRVDHNNYDVTIFRPFQETNRYLQTQRTPKDNKNVHERSQHKPALRLRTQHPDSRQIRTDYTDATPEKYRKEPSTKHTTEKVLRVPPQDVRRLMAQLLREKAEVMQLKKEIQFYRAHAGEGSSNSVLRSLRV